MYHLHLLQLDELQRIIYNLFQNAKPLSRKVFFLNTDATNQRDFSQGSTSYASFSLTLVIDIPNIPNICGLFFLNTKSTKETKFR